MRSLLQEHPPASPEQEAGTSSSPPLPVLVPEDDVLSLAASASHFRDDEGGQASMASEPGSPSSGRSSLSEAADGSVQAIMRAALERLQLEVPVREDFLRELHSCWRDPAGLSRLSADGRALAAMHDAAGAGLERMPEVEPAIASLIVSPEETLRPTVRCPRPQCRVTDDILTRTYNTGARAGRIGNSLAHLMFALSASLQEGNVDPSALSFSDAALQAFALVSRELGRMMSLLVQARRQLATGDSYQTIGNSFRVGVSSASQIMPDVVSAIWDCLVGKFIAVPITEEWRSIAEGFEEQWNFSLLRCCGWEAHQDPSP
ncbi:uncharacterized protein V6R79_008983 [Siganus canaliculatus]